MANADGSLKVAKVTERIGPRDLQSPLTLERRIHAMINQSQTRVRAERGTRLGEPRVLIVVEQEFLPHA